VALEGLGEKERVPMTLAGIRFCWQTGQLPEADRLLGGLLGDAKLREQAALWRLASEIASKRDMTARSLECLEKALDAEYRQLPEVIDLTAVRRDYGKLLAHYQSLADAMVTLQVKPPEGFVARSVRAADRWRALDREAGAASSAVAAILQRLGERELGWDYLTTPVALSPAEAGPWLQLAGNLRQRGDLELADRAYTSAYETEPTNAQILWDRAQNLRQAGRTVEAQRLLRQIAEGQWQPRFQGLKAQARMQVQAQ
jgi:tetratricopeptide (TPR) repeat protein